MASNNNNNFKKTFIKITLIENNDKKYILIYQSIKIALILKKHISM